MNRFLNVKFGSDYSCSKFERNQLKKTAAAQIQSFPFLFCLLVFFFLWLTVDSAYMKLEYKKTSL